jgi:hypothetical protein
VVVSVPARAAVAAARAKIAIPSVMTIRFMLLLLFQGMFVLDNPTIGHPRRNPRAGAV